MPDNTPTAALIYGTDEMRVKDRAAQLAAAMTPPGDWGTEIIDAWQDNVEAALSAIRSATQALQTPPFLGGEQFIWLKNVSFFSDTETIKISGNAEIITSLENLAKIISGGLADGVRLLISAPGAKAERAKKDEPPAPLQLLEDSGILTVEKIHLPAASPFAPAPAPVADIAQAFKDVGLRLHPEALQRLIDLSNNNPRQIRSEVEKLIIHCWGQQEVTPHHVTAIVTPTAEETFWTWCDAVVEGRTADALDLLRQLRFQGENPVGLLINLLNHSRLLVKVKLLTDRRLISTSGSPTGAGAELLDPVGDKKSPPSPGRLKRIQHQARRYSFAEWSAFFQNVYQTYAAYFETGHDHYTMLNDLVLRLHIGKQKTNYAA